MDIGTSSKYKKVNEDTLFYKAAWRWHFYAGIFVTPFMLILAVTGMLMMYIGYFDGRDGEKVTVPVPPNAIMLTLQEQSNIALSTHPKGKLVEWIKASEPNRVNVLE